MFFAPVEVQKSIGLNPGKPGTSSTGAWIHYEMGDRQKAIDATKKATDIFHDRVILRDLETFQKR